MKEQKLNIKIELDINVDDLKNKKKIAKHIKKFFKNLSKISGDGEVYLETEDKYLEGLLKGNEKDNI